MTPKLESTELGPYLNWYKIGDHVTEGKYRGPKKSTWDTKFTFKKQPWSNHVGWFQFYTVEVDLELVQFFIWPGCPNFVVLLDLMMLTGY